MQTRMRSMKRNSRQTRYDLQPIIVTLIVCATMTSTAAQVSTGRRVQQSRDEAAAKSFGCIQCHTDVGNMHNSDAVVLGCTDCHGGDATSCDKQVAHVQPSFPDQWRGSGNPVRSYTLLNRERPEFIRFVNPGDLRVAHISCGNCHAHEVLAVKKSMMTHGCMLWGAALYNNGAVPNKASRYGESYSMHGAPQRIQTVPTPTTDDTRLRAVLPFVDPLPRFEISQPGNLLRVFERGGRLSSESGIPHPLERPGRPRERLSTRGLGTGNRTDPVFLGLQKTRLLDPTLNFLGTNDHPGDYRSSGCTACHVVYANDRSPVHSGPFAKYGNRGTAAAELDDWVRAIDPTIPKNEPGHPIQHRFTLSIPTSQCISCHIHPGTNVLNSYLGMMWWDNETDGEFMYPSRPKRMTAEEYHRASMSNPDEASLRGNWSDPEFLTRVSELNPQLQRTQFADFHGHGWVFRAVFKKDRTGNLLDHRSKVIPRVTPVELNAAMEPPTSQERVHGKCRENIPVHLMDIHLEKGMHCIDCHFYQDSHGDTNLYGEVRAAIEITCKDCHGSAEQTVIDVISRQLAVGKPARLSTSGPASRGARGTDLLAFRTPFGQPRFEVMQTPDGVFKLVQRSMVEKGLTWEVVQTASTINPDSKDYNVKSHMAKTVRMAQNGRLTWGGRPSDCAHQDDQMSCVSCHSSWNASCYGCHLPQKANRRTQNLHFEGDVSRNQISYNFQTLRDDVFMLARDGNATGNRINPARSSCAIHVSSYNKNREVIYSQQQTISAEGFSGIAFSTNVPHTVRGGPGVEYDNGAYRPGVTETKMCTDCHVSKNDDNNAILAQLLMQGTNVMNFIGRHCWVAAGKGGTVGVVVTERDEPQAVIGSSLHRLAFPDRFATHQRNQRRLNEGYWHSGKDGLRTLLPFKRATILDVQARGEYLYAACGTDGFRVFDIASADNKGFSQRITTSPVSPLGQDLHVPTEYAAAIASPATTALDPTRAKREENEEGPIHPIYGYLYVADRVEGLILVGAATLLDGNPLNNQLTREVTFNPNGMLRGARAITIVGTYAYIGCDAGLVVVSLDDPKCPRITAVLGPDVINCATSIAVQFRYAFVCDCDGVKVLDVTRLDEPRLISELPLEDARQVYVARTYAYVAAGRQGLVMLDVTNPELPQIDQVFDAEGCINDLCDVKLGITNASQFAYLADGKNGLRVVQLTSASLPTKDGFSPRPRPRLIATYPLKPGARALVVSEGVDRDRAVDESGNQLSVFGRVGARPLNLEEQRRLYLNAEGTVWKVSDNPFDKDIYDLRRSPPLPHERKTSIRLHVPE